MKLLINIILSALLIFTLSCKKEQTSNSITEENNQCICTMEYAPVCGSDNKTYSNACGANCAKVKFTAGECSK